MVESNHTNNKNHHDTFDIEDHKILYHPPETIVEKLAYLQQNSNFSQDAHNLRGEDLKVNIFVNHEKRNQRGQLIENTPEKTKSEERKEEYDSSDEEEEEESVDNENENEEEEVEITNKYIVDMIAEEKDLTEELILHWGIGKKVACEWTAPDDQFLPPETKRWPDGKACQTKFVKDTTFPNLRQIHFDFTWKQDSEPAVKSMSFVFLEQKKNAWLKNGGQDFHLKFQIEPEHAKNKDLPFGKIGDVVQEIIDCETVYHQWTLMHRYGKCREILNNKIDQASRDQVAYLFIWLRFSFTRQLTWQKNYNTKPKDLQGAQVSLVDEICGQFIRLFGKDREHFLTSDDFLRSMLTMIGKGSGNGQRVRDEILNIMHRQGIKETSGHFYEQWHQKLHNNTTPDDIHICEGLLAYLRTGNMGKYWEVLNANGVTRERLASFERKITTEPYMHAQAIPDFENYLVILKQMHSSGDLELLSNEAKQHLGNDTKGMLDDIFRNFGDNDVLRQMERVTKLRYNLNQSHMDRGNFRKLKDILFLDLGLESYIRGLTERIIHIDIGFEAYVREAAIILSNLVLSYQWNELNVCKDDWDKIVQPNCKNMNEDIARRIKSVVDRIKQSLGEVTDQFSNVVQSKAELLGKSFGIAEGSYKIFSEELIRGTLFFSLSMIMKKIDPYIRKCAHLGDFLVISQGRSHGSRGYAEKVKNLSDVMHKTYERRTVLFCEKINGEEEVPNNVQAIILIDGTDFPDVLAHVSVRARNLKVMFIVCFDEGKSKELLSLEGKHIFLAIENHMVRFQEQSPNFPITRRASSSLILQNIIDKAKDVKSPPDFPKAFMLIDEFTSKHMGAKSNNLKVLKDSLEKWIFLPESGCIPFKMMEYTLDLHPQIRDDLHEFIEQLINIKKLRKMNRLLYKCKDLVMKLEFHPDDKIHASLKESLIKFGIPSKDFEQAWKTIKMVWASKFNERAFLATKKIGVTLHSIYMAVLVQRIIPSEYAYVIHTSNPTNGEDEEVYVEACLGLGEALVSTMAGQAFSFTYNKSSHSTVVNAYPNKPLGLKAEGFIFRSDSNSEDLSGFAGAGLFDSYPMHDTSEFRITYNKERLFIDKQFRENFMMNIGRIGEAIENLYGGAQDIEGAFYDNKFHVVQTRPQV